MRDLTLNETIAAKHGYKQYLGLLGIKSRDVMLLTVDLQTKASGMIAWTITKRETIPLATLIREMN